MIYIFVLWFNHLYDILFQANQESRLGIILIVVIKACPKPAIEIQDNL